MSKRYIDVGCGWNHTMAISNKKKLYIWGQGKYGCNGKLNVETKLRPFKVDKTIFGEEKYNLLSIYYFIK